MNRQTRKQKQAQVLERVQQSSTSKSRLVSTPQQEGEVSLSGHMPDPDASISDAAADVGLYDSSDREAPEIDLAKQVAQAERKRHGM